MQHTNGITTWELLIISSWERPCRTNGSNNVTTVIKSLQYKSFFLCYKFFSFIAWDVVCSLFLFFFPIFIFSLVNILDLDDQINEMSLQMSNRHWECTMCGKVSQQKSDLKKHIESLHLHLNLPCMLCPKVFRTRHSRFSHLRKTHGVSNK